MLVTVLYLGIPEDGLAVNIKKEQSDRCSYIVELCFDCCCSGARCEERRV